ncbi:NUDIX domain-containing protein [Streptomyces buecherae]|uniref:NUDIX hydrolase n=1 Tax=Streptomyces buecherae TaxID=2763006 RepID=A0A7H8N9C0_9ACTN|nr:NUDIX domain-containing protein [Streptomyces buecherae]QKW51051.1 NUDIX hydrolase [Streptomyces buecherae]
MSDRDVLVMVLVRHVDRPAVLRVRNPATGVYELPSGLLEPGELVQEAAVRIVRERCGLRVQALALLAFDQSPPEPAADRGATEKWTLVVDGGLATGEFAELPLASGLAKGSQVYQWADLRRMSKPSGVVAWSLIVSRADSLLPLLVDGEALLSLPPRLAG